MAKEQITWSVERRKVHELLPYSKNPRRIGGKKLDDLRRSIAKFGVAELPTINTDGTLIGGHARVLVARESGIREMDVLVPSRELSEQEHAELTVRLNKNIAGEWDFETLANLYDADELRNWGFEDWELGMGDEPQESSDEEPEKFSNQKYMVVVVCANREKAEDLSEQLSADGNICSISKGELTPQVKKGKPRK